MNDEQRIAKINELSLHLRSIWIGLLVALVFVGITLMGHRDADFFAFGAATTLPVVSVNVHPAAFFLAAPILISAIYVYLHIFLLSLWDHIGDAKAKHGSDQAPLSDLVSPTIFALAAIWYRNRFRADGSMAPNVLGIWIVAIALALGWAFGLFVLLLVWVRGMPLHDFGMTVVAAASLWAAMVVSALSLRSAEGRMRGRSRKTLASVGATFSLVAGTALLVIILVSWERTKGGLLAQLGLPTGALIPLATADLREAELTKRPADWQPFELWLSSVGLDQVSDATQKSKIQRLWQNRISSLEAPDLSGRDLRGADLSNAFLPGANLRGADLTGVRMQGASLEGANFRGSTFEHVDLNHAALQGAELSGLKISRSDFSFARMEFSDLYSSRVLESDFSYSNLSDADLGLALFLASRLIEAQLVRTELGEAAVARSDFSGAMLRSSNLSFFFASETQFPEIDFSDSDLSHGYFLNSNFTHAKFSADTFDRTCLIYSNLAGAEFSAGANEQEDAFSDRVEFSGSSLINADLSELDGMLTMDMIFPAYGGNTTQLPPGLETPPHWSTGPVLGLGGGGTFTPDPPWFDRTREQIEAARSRDDSSNSSYYVEDGWAEWRSNGPFLLLDSYFCAVNHNGAEGREVELLDARGIDYQGLEEDVYGIMGPDWSSAPEPELQ